MSAPDKRSTGLRCGICYVADTDGYLDEAMQSIGSLRAHMPDVPVAIVTHRRLFRAAREVTDWVELQQERSGPIIKTDARLAPYDRVIFLDTDTYVAGDLAELFDLLEVFDLAAAQEVHRGVDYGTRYGIPRALPDYNTGVLAFRNGSTVEGFFRSWQQDYDLLLEERGVRNDQPAFRNALWRSSSLRFAGLGREHNLIGCGPAMVEGAVKVVHDRSHSGLLASDLNRELGARVFAPGWGTIFGFRGRRDWVRQYLRLTTNFLRVLINPNSLRQRPTPVTWWRDGID